MADYPRQGSSDRTLRSHGEQIRRIRTRIPIGDQASTYQVTFADCNGTGGWEPTGSPFPTFVRQGDICFLNGMFHYRGSTTPSTIIIAAGVIPAEFRPHVETRLHGNGNGFTTDRFWTLLYEPNGQLTLASLHSDPAVVFPYGKYDDGVDDYPVSIIGPPWPSVDLAAGDFPP